MARNTLWQAGKTNSEDRHGVAGKQAERQAGKQASRQDKGRESDENGIRRQRETKLVLLSLLYEADEDGKRRRSKRGGGEKGSRRRTKEENEE